jgi:predicted cobalt transporter CbtA
MNRFLKTLLLWLLIAALPLQGFAAAMLVSCGSAHDDSLQVAIMNDEHHDDSAAVHSHHHDVADADSSSSDSTANADKSSATHDKHQHSSCSVCAACCVGAVAPPSALNFTPVHSGSETVVISPAPLVTGYIPGGLERPPRHIFA